MIEKLKPAIALLDRHQNLMMWSIQILWELSFMKMAGRSLCELRMEK